jgi:MinD-like ATPase involved in chromosome partitioning or flagellar assembly
VVVVLILAAGAAWESTVLGRLEREPGMVVLRRCVDVPDLLAAASAGQADVAVVALDAPGLDPAAVDHLRRFQVRPVAVVPSSAVGADGHLLQAARLGIASAVSDDDLPSLPDTIRADEDPAGAGAGLPAPSAVDAADPGEASGEGRVIAVWGPAGAPGRTSVAVAVAAELAARGRRTTLVDADPYGGAVAQQLGILDEVSGLLAAARLAGTGLLEDRFASVQRAVDDRLTVVTGLPRADRWVEVRAGAVEHLLEVAAARGDVVVDTGFSVESDPTAELGARPARNQMTLASLGEADELVVVGAADPVGLSRLARALVELREVTDGAPVRVVVNRMRPTLGWSEKDIAGMVEGFARLVGLHFLPDDRPTVDRALVAGRTLTEVGDSPLRRAVGDLVDALAPSTVAAPSGRVRGRRSSGHRGRRGSSSPSTRRR